MFIGVPGSSAMGSGGGGGAGAGGGDGVVSDGVGVGVSVAVGAGAATGVAGRLKRRADTATTATSRTDKRAAIKRRRFSPAGAAGSWPGVPGPIRSGPLGVLTMT
jgi:hypothetical protein